MCANKYNSVPRGLFLKLARDHDVKASSPILDYWLCNKRKLCTCYLTSCVDIDVLREKTLKVGSKVNMWQRKMTLRKGLLLPQETNTIFIQTWEYNCSLWNIVHWIYYALTAGNSVSSSGGKMRQVYNPSVQERSQCIFLAVRYVCRLVS